MNIPLLPPNVLMCLLAAAQPILARGAHREPGFLRGHVQHEEAFRTFETLARVDETGPGFRLAAYYYSAEDDVRAALWFLITGVSPGGGEGLPMAA